MRSKLWWIVCALVASSTLLASHAEAFCGFYVGGAGAKLFNDKDPEDREFKLVVIAAPWKYNRTPYNQKVQDQLILNKPSLTAPTNFNLLNAKKELLKWHCRLSHLYWNAVKWLMRQGFLCNFC